MDLHRVRRLAGVLIASQLRSGRSTSDPESFFGTPGFLAVIDTAAFAGAALLAWLAVRVSGLPTAAWAQLVGPLLPFLPLVGLSVVLVAGTMFELTATVRFSGSDAAHWLPLDPSEYAMASATAIAFSYSPSIALALGGVLPVAFVSGTFVPYLVAAGLSVVALLQGGLVIEIVRAVGQRAGAVAASRGGRATLVVRAALLILVILAVQLAFNPVVLLAVVHDLASVLIVTAIVPFLWSTQTVFDVLRGDPWLALAFGAGQVAFLGVLVDLAGWARARYWVPAGSEADVGPVRFAAGHPWFSAAGLSAPESAVAAKDLKGFVRRREMMPTLVVPVVFVVLIFLEGGSLGALGVVLWLGWIVGFFGLILATTSVGQERRSLQLLLATPITPRGLHRAKVAAVLVPVLIASVLVGAAVGVYFGFDPVHALALVAISATAGVELTLWGLVFAARYSDFQDRPRPQFLRPSGMLAATASGTVLLFAFLVPAAFALAATGMTAIVAGLVATAIAVGFGVLSIVWSRSGFEALFRELPF